LCNVHSDLKLKGTGGVLRNVPSPPQPFQRDREHLYPTIKGQKIQSPSKVVSKYSGFGPRNLSLRRSFFLGSLFPK
jgi:hypothetical protein